MSCGVETSEVKAGDVILYPVMVRPIKNRERYSDDYIAIEIRETGFPSTDRKFDIRVFYSRDMNLDFHGRYNRKEIILFAESFGKKVREISFEPDCYSIMTSGKLIPFFRQISKIGGN